MDLVTRTSMIARREKKYTFMFVVRCQLDEEICSQEPISEELNLGAMCLSRDK